MAQRFHAQRVHRPLVSRVSRKHGVFQACAAPLHRLNDAGSLLVPVHGAGRVRMPPGLDLRSVLEGATGLVGCMLAHRMRARALVGREIGRRCAGAHSAAPRGGPPPMTFPGPSDACSLAETVGPVPASGWPRTRRVAGGNDAVLTQALQHAREAALLRRHLQCFRYAYDAVVLGVVRAALPWQPRGAARDMLPRHPLLSRAGRIFIGRTRAEAVFSDANGRPVRCCGPFVP